MEMKLILNVKYCKIKQNQISTLFYVKPPTYITDLADPQRTQLTSGEPTRIWLEKGKGVLVATPSQNIKGFIGSNYHF